MARKDAKASGQDEAERAGAVDDVPPGLKRSVRRAEKLGKDKVRVKTLLAQAAAKAVKSRDRLGEAWHGLQTLFRLLKAWATGKYDAVPWRVVVLGIATVLYFVNPFDLIPDFLGFGLLDDVGVMAFAGSMMREDLERFREWERKQGVVDIAPTEEDVSA